LRDTVAQFAKSATEGPATAVSVSAVTTWFNISYLLDKIPDSIGKLAALIGIFLSLVLIYSHIRLGRIKYKNLLLEIKIKEEKLKECHKEIIEQKEAE